MSKILTAADAIAAKTQSRIPDPSSEAMHELKELVKYNDKQPSHDKKVGAATAIEILNSFGWAGSSKPKLDEVCRRLLGRKSYGTK